MTFLKKIVDFYIDSSIHVAFAAYAFIRITMLMLNITYDEPVAFFGFYGTITAYNFIKYFHYFTHTKRQIALRLKAIIVISFCSFIASIIYFFQLVTSSKIVAIITFCIALIYGFPFFSWMKAARNWIGFKVFLVVISWTIVTFLIPILNENFSFSNGRILFGIQRFLLIYAVMCIFEIIDLQFDAISLQTIPQRIGVARTKLLGIIFLIIYSILELFRFSTTSPINLFFVLFIAVFVYFSNSYRSKYYTHFWVESIPIFWWFVLVKFTCF